MIRRCRRVTYPESYIIKYATYSEINVVFYGHRGPQGGCGSLLSERLGFLTLKVQVIRI